MPTNSDTELQTPGSVADADLDPRDVRALTQYLTVLDDDPRVSGADDLFLVVSESGEEYLVDVRENSCECTDYRFRQAELGERGCKHRRRVAFATGERAIPMSVDPARIDRQMGTHVEGTPRVTTTDGGTSAGSVDDALPPDAYRLGTDRDGRDHWHSPLSGRIWAFRGGELLAERDLDGRSVVDWVAFVDDEHGGWADRQPVERPGGIAGAVAGALEAMERRQ